MAINPIRVLPLDIPTALPSGARAPEGTFANLASIGDALGAYHLRQQIGDIVSSATDEQGNVDQNKALAGLARAGLVSPEQLSTMGYRQQLLGQHASDAAALEAHRRSLEESAAITANRPGYHYVPPTQGDILTPGTPGYMIEEPRKPGQAPIIRNWPGPAAPPPSTPGPQSALPGGPSFASFDPESAPPTPPTFRGIGNYDIENAPPYRVAGPPMPPPQAPAATQPAATAERNEAYLNSLPIPEGGKTLIRGIANYDIDPASIPAEIRAKALAAAKTYRPDYSASEFQKRGSPPPPEAQARIGLARGFIDRLGDTTDEQGNPIPGIRSRIIGGELNSYENRAKAFVGQGGPGELRRGIDEGADALLRTLTGAGMNLQEAADYTRRYRFSPIDTQETQLRKLNELEAALRHVSTEMGKGRGGEDLLKGFKSQYGQPVTATPAARVPDNAVRYLQANPGTRDAFDAKYGTGAADRALGRR